MPFGRRGAPSDGFGRRRVRELAARAAGDPRVIHQVVAEHAARVGEPAWRRVEEDARGLERLRAEQHRARPDFLHLARHAVDVHDAGRLVRSTDRSGPCRPSRW